MNTLKQRLEKFQIKIIKIWDTTQICDTLNNKIIINEWYK